MNQELLDNFVNLPPELRSFVYQNLDLHGYLSLLTEDLTSQLEDEVYYNMTRYLIEDASFDDVFSTLVNYQLPEDIREELLEYIINSLNGLVPYQNERKNLLSMILITLKSDMNEQDSMDLLNHIVSRIQGNIRARRAIDHYAYWFRLKDILSQISLSPLCYTTQNLTNQERMNVQKEVYDISIHRHPLLANLGNDPHSYFLTYMGIINGKDHWRCFTCDYQYTTPIGAAGSEKYKEIHQVSAATYTQFIRRLVNPLCLQIVKHKFAII